MSGYIGRHRADAADRHQMEFWQRHCMWHARCSCGASGTGYDGATAMADIAHKGPGRPAEPLMGICTNAPLRSRAS